MDKKGGAEKLREQVRIKYSPGTIDRVVDLILSKYEPHKREMAIREAIDPEIAYDYVGSFLDFIKDSLEDLSKHAPAPLHLEIHPPPDNPNDPCAGFKCEYCYARRLETISPLSNPEAIQPTEMRDGKPVIRYFVSYAHEDNKLKEKLLTPLKQLLKIAKDYCFEVWDDTEIVAGDD